jgi:hypothetical protein
MTKRYSLPDCLVGKTDEPAYVRWLRRKAAAHVKCDRKRCDWPITGERYRQLIHQAVKRCEGRDYYTGEELHWGLLSKYSNEKSQLGRSAYKADFALLPTADHVPGTDDKYDFVICSWRTNDAKNDLGHDEFIALCRRVVEFHDRKEGAVTE